MPRRKKQPDPAVEDVTAVTPNLDKAEPLAEHAAPAQSPSAPADGTEEPTRQWAAGPRWFKSVSLSEDRNGPKMDLGRDQKFKQMAIRFSEKPEGEVIDALHAAGWTWRGKEKYWTKQLDAARPATSERDAEVFFEGLAEGMRARRGLGESPAVG